MLKLLCILITLLFLEDQRYEYKTLEIIYDTNEISFDWLYREFKGERKEIKVKVYKETVEDSDNIDFFFKDYSTEGN